jgi:peptidoglycan/xylan/chitin deacetylase (PgdA/CDA1 family)
MLGEKIEGQDDVINKMIEIGCELGNHSFDHAQLSALSASDVQSQMSRTDDLLIAACGKSATVMRPPYGDYAGEAAANVGLPIVLWNIDTLDWESRNTEAIIQNVKSWADDGDIVLMHDIYDTTIDAAIELIPYLIGEGYQLVTISEFAEARGLTLENGVAITDFNLQ